MEFKDTVLRSYPTGSRYICNPAPKDTDNDTVVLVNGYYEWPDLLEKEGWERCGEDYGDDGSQAFRKGEENYIVMEDEELFKKWIYATEAAKALNLLKKEDRIALFSAIKFAGEGYIGLERLNVRRWDFQYFADAVKGKVKDVPF